MNNAPLPWRTGLSYGALALPLAFLALPLYVNLPHHATQRHGLPLAALGALLLGTRLLDALLDPFIGRWMDRLFAGPRRRLAALATAAAALLVLGFAALFFAPLWPPGPLMAWLGVALVLVYLAFSSLSVLHQAWGTRLGGDAARRSGIAAWREGLGLLGVLLASVVAATWGFGAATVVLALALLGGLTLLQRVPPAELANHAASRLARRPESATDTVPSADWRLPWRQPRFRPLLAVYLLNGLANAVPATLLAFFVQDRLQASPQLALFLACYFAAAALALPLWVRAVRRLGLVPVWLAGMVLAVAAFASALALGPGDSAAFAAICVASGLALGADLSAPAALLTGLVQRERQQGAEGVYAGWWTAATKLNLGLAAGLALPLLALAGYVPGERSTTSLQALALAYMGLPCTLKLLAATLLWRRWRREPEQWT